jgi:ammonium transporter, Amt family
VHPLMHLIAAVTPPSVSDPAWLNTGDNAWQLTAATFVALMSVPGLAVLWAGLVQKKWVVNSMLMTFAGFAAVLIVWVLWAYKMGFGSPVGQTFKDGTSNFTYGGNALSNFFHNFIGRPGTFLSGPTEEGQASIPMVDAGMPPFGLPGASVFYFQFVFAAITPLLFLGSVLGRIKFKVWLLFVPLWISLVYAVNAMLLWGGGYWAHEGAADFSGGYVIHLAAGTSGFVAAAVIGPRLKRDREKSLPHSLPLIAIGGGIVWLGWNGFNGGDPYFASADAAAAVVNTNLCTAAALLTWVLWDMYVGPAKKPTFLGAINGMVVGLVVITPAAGYVDGAGALMMGAIGSSVVWLSWTYLSRTALFRRVDDAMGVVHTHGVAGLTGGLLVGVFADPSVVEYKSVGGAPYVVSGWIYGNHPKQILIQALAALTVILWDGTLTFLILKFISIFTPLRYSDEELEGGDLAIHDEEAYPETDGATRVEPGGYGGGSSVPDPASAITVGGA